LLTSRKNSNDSKVKKKIELITGMSDLQLNDVEKM